ncbi:DUF1183-domain-containing protein [Myriangium duriaei CBS 260.36]|uniref:Store-operated calcium entry-associated regulatory factor n=1 Tax=Myriangium duriaei CBS 260.36 TaxID=1168546 RepID=A0A9P4J3W2_9PEZI|nr:DUF1183-domain-containing protein [Myriangium duriaei CBS 260.36]
MRLCSLAAIFLTLLLGLSTSFARSSNAILLSKVRTLTLRQGKQTSHRRVPAIPQLKCIGGNGRSHYEVDAMRCTNIGGEYDGDDVQWTCTANLPPEFKLGSTEVLCEGYSSSTDPYVLKGSCGVEYRLQLTELGEQKYGSFSSMSRGDKAIFVVFVGVLVWMLYDGCFGGARNRRQGRQGFGGGWGGGGGGPGDDGNDPPPPYSRMPPPKGGSNTQQNPGGFWTTAAAAAAGAAGGYMAGRAGGNGRDRGRYYDRFQDRHDTWGRSNRSYNDRSDSGSSRSSTTYQSSGFGGTTRR